MRYKRVLALATLLIVLSTVGIAAINTGEPWRGHAKVTVTDNANYSVRFLPDGGTCDALDSNLQGDSDKWQYGVNNSDATLCIAQTQTDDLIGDSGPADDIWVQFRQPKADTDTSDQLGATTLHISLGDFTRNASTHTINWDSDPLDGAFQDSEPRWGAVHLWMNVSNDDSGLDQNAWTCNSEGEVATAPSNGECLGARGYGRNNATIHNLTISNASYGGDQPDPWAFPDQLFVQADFIGEGFKDQSEFNYNVTLDLKHGEMVGAPVRTQTNGSKNFPTVPEQLTWNFTTNGSLVDDSFDTGPDDVRIRLNENHIFHPNATTDEALVFNTTGHNVVGPDGSVELDLEKHVVRRHHSLGFSFPAVAETQLQWFGRGTAFNTTPGDDGVLRVEGYNISTAEFVTDNAAPQFTPEAIVWNNDGTRLFTVDPGPTLYQFKASTPFDIKDLRSEVNRSLPKITDPQGLAWNNDGTKLYIVDEGGIGSPIANVTQYRASDPFNISTIKSTASKNIESESGVASGIAWNNDGTTMYISEAAGDEIDEYKASSPFNVKSTTFTQDSGGLANNGNTEGVTWNNDGTKLFAPDSTGSDIDQYEASTPFDVSTLSFTQSLRVISQEGSPRAVAWNNDGTQMYMGGQDNDTVNQYNVSSLPRGNWTSDTHAFGSNLRALETFQVAVDKLPATTDLWVTLEKKDDVDNSTVETDHIHITDTGLLNLSTTIDTFQNLRWSFNMTNTTGPKSCLVPVGAVFRKRRRGTRRQLSNPSACSPTQQTPQRQSTRS